LGDRLIGVAFLITEVARIFGPQAACFHG
jgi:hypothetical protein